MKDIGIWIYRYRSMTPVKFLKRPYDIIPMTQLQNLFRWLNKSQADNIRVFRIYNRTMYIRRKREANLPFTGSFSAPDSAEIMDNLPLGNIGDNDKRATLLR